MTKMGVVGLGAMGQHHVRLYSQLDCELAGVSDIDVTRAKEIGKRYQVPYYADYRDMFRNVDAVSIAVPTSSHYNVAMDFIVQGVHCLVEKPIALNLDEAKSMIDAAEQHKVKLGIGHIERFNPAVLKLKQILDRGSLGKLLTVSTRRVSPFVPRIKDVGIVLDSAIHDIGVVRYLVGRSPVCIYSRVGSVKHLKEDHAIIVLDFETAMASIEVNWLSPHKARTLVATGSEGTAFLDYIEQKLTIDSTGNTATVDVTKEEPLKLELEDFLSSVGNGTMPAVDGKEGLEVLKIAQEACNHDNYASQLVLHH